MHKVVRCLSAWNSDGHRFDPGSLGKQLTPDRQPKRSFVFVFRIFEKESVKMMSQNCRTTLTAAWISFNLFWDHSLNTLGVCT